MPASDLAPPDAAARNLRLYPWFRFLQNLIFWQAVWFLFFQNQLSAAEAILLYAVYDVTTTALEVPSGYLSDRLGRRPTLILAAVSALAGAALLALGGSFIAFALGQALLGASTSFASGTDSALLYESLERVGRKQEVEAQEMCAWRFGFVALAFSAATGGAMAMVWDRPPFFAGGAAGVALLAVTLLFRETASADEGVRRGEIARLFSLRDALRDPVLQWLLVLSVSMYVFSHVPFVFGQPFILQSLTHVGLQSEAPLISGLVSAAMMLLSVAASWLAIPLRRRAGLGPILLLAFGLQIGLIAGLSLTGSALAIALLLVRMVPDSLSWPFIVARIQPLLSNDIRATYLSVKSLIGRLVFALSLWLAASVTTSEAAMSMDEVRVVLSGYALAGFGLWLGLALARRRVAIDR